MGSATYATAAIVLRKTKLGESDLIVTLLNADGSLLRCVAKGARKPSSGFSSRLELFAVVDVLCVRGRSLDIVKEARLVASNDAIRLSVERMTAASPIAELLGKVAQEGLENRVLFDSARVALSALNDASPEAAPAVSAAYLLKGLAFAGLRPSLAQCVGCGESAVSQAGHVPFSFTEGGVVCPACRPHCETMPYPEQALSWAQYLMGSRFSDIVAREVPLDASFSVLRLAQGLVKTHVGGTLKSLEFMLTCGLW